MKDEYGFGGRQVLDAALQLPVSAGGDVNPENFSNIAADGPYNNMGVPGIKSFQLLPGAEVVSQLNPYYARFAATPGNSTVLQEVLAQEPTFYTLWIGANDVLGYALTAGSNIVGGDSITSYNTFLQSFSYFVTQLALTGAKGVVARFRI